MSALRQPSIACPNLLLVMRYCVPLTDLIDRAFSTDLQAKEWHPQVQRRLPVR